MRDFKEILKRAWYFIWEEDSVASWIVNILLAFILIKFIVYPGLGFLLGTNYPVVAVVSSSMEHNNLNFNDWWQSRASFYSNLSIDENEFEEFDFSNGFNKGDIMILVEAKPDKIKLGQIIVYKSGKPDPIIHRVVNINKIDEFYHFQTKGDNNINQIKTAWLDETDIPQNVLLGKAAIRIPYLGWIKILFVDLLGLAGVK